MQLILWSDLYVFSSLLCFFFLQSSSIKICLWCPCRSNGWTITTRKFVQWWDQSWTNRDWVKKMSGCWGTQNLFLHPDHLPPTVPPHWRSSFWPSPSHCTTAESSEKIYSKPSTDLHLNDHMPESSSFIHINAFCLPVYTVCLCVCVCVLIV